MKPYSDHCKNCGGEDCVCCDYYYEAIQPAFESDYDPFDDWYEDEEVQI